MLERATERVRQATPGRITTIQGDIRQVELPDGNLDIVLAAAVLHHLRAAQEWRDVFASFHRALRPGGSVWVFDLVESSIPAIQGLMRSVL
jgi:tRNA (cmo5U34)-methyltransferase